MTTTTAYAWATITKSVKQDDGTLMVYGPATDAGVDRDRQKMDQAWLDKAMPAWMAEGGNVRGQHNPQDAVGVGVGLTRADDGTHNLAAHVVDPIAVKKVEAGVFKGFSVGIKDPHITFGKADAPAGVVDGGTICEVSLVDRPSNPRTLFTMVKADAAGALEDVEDAAVEETGAVDEPEETPLAKAEAAVTTLRDLLTKAETYLATIKPGDPVTAPTTTTPPVETPAPTKVDNPDVAAIVKAAIAEAMTPLKDELVLVKADLVKALAMPETGGPVGMRTASQTEAARAADRTLLRAQASQYLVKADEVSREDRDLAQGYREKAAELNAKADA